MLNVEFKRAFPSVHLHCWTDTAFRLIPYLIEIRPSMYSIDLHELIFSLIHSKSENFYLKYKMSCLCDLHASVLIL